MGNPVFDNQKNFQNGMPFQPNPQQQKQSKINFEELFEKFKQNPHKYLGNLNLPPNIQTPEQAVRYAAETNQIPPLIQRQIYAFLNKK